MRVDVPDRFFFLLQIIKTQRKHNVLEHIGMIPGVKGVTIAEHKRASR
jgi:hypothetical protein